MHDELAKRWRMEENEGKGIWRDKAREWRDHIEETDEITCIDFVYLNNSPRPQLLLGQVTELYLLVFWHLFVFVRPSFKFVLIAVFRATILSGLNSWAPANCDRSVNHCASWVFHEMLTWELIVILWEAQFWGFYWVGSVCLPELLVNFNGGVFFASWMFNEILSGFKQKWHLMSGLLSSDRR